MSSRNTMLAALALSGLIGCAGGGDESLLLLHNAAPGDGCTVAPTTTFVARGAIDTGADRGYLFTPVVENITSTSSTATRVAIVEGANIELGFRPDFYDEGEVAALAEQGLTSFSQSFSGSIDPEGGQAAFGFEIIPKLLLEDMAGKLGDGESTEVTAAITIYGEIDGGGVESNTFTYPVDVCRGCLAVNLGECSALPAGTTPRTGGVCQPLQDGVVDCCTTNGSLVCPAVPVEPQ